MTRKVIIGPERKRPTERYQNRRMVVSPENRRLAVRYDKPATSFNLILVGFDSGAFQSTAFQIAEDD